MDIIAAKPKAAWGGDHYAACATWTVALKSTGQILAGPMKIERVIFTKHYKTHDVSLREVDIKRQLVALVRDNLSAQASNARNKQNLLPDTKHLNIVIENLEIELMHPKVVPMRPVPILDVVRLNNAQSFESRVS